MAGPDQPGRRSLLLVGGTPLRTVAEHRQAALALVTPLSPVDRALDDADGHVLAQDVVAATLLPRWDNSAMDGYAVRTADLTGASTGSPVTLRVLADLPAGSDQEPVVGPGTAARIMTGAPVPPGADAVVPVESTDGGTDQVRVDDAPAPGAHVRRAGEDVRAGDVVLAAGALLGPTQIAAAASVGCAHVLVHRRPRIAVLSTGSELVTPGAELRRGQIPDSNSYLLAAAVRATGCDVVRTGAVGDVPDALRAALAACTDVDAVVTSGGVSMGAYDVVKEVLSAHDEMEFVQVAMQPGKPQGLGRYAGTPLFALPGNPVSAWVSFEVFVRPALLRLRGLHQVDRPRAEAIVADGWRSPAGREQYMPVVEAGSDTDDGAPGDGARLKIRRAVAGGSGSHLVAGLARAQGLAVVDARTVDVEPGDRVRVMWMDR